MGQCMGYCACGYVWEYCCSVEGVIIIIIIIITTIITIIIIIIKIIIKITFKT